MIHRLSSSGMRKSNGVRLILIRGWLYLLSLSVTGLLCQRRLSLNDAVSRYLNPGLWSFYSVVQYNNDDKVVVIKCIPLVLPPLAI